MVPDTRGRPGSPTPSGPSARLKAKQRLARLLSALAATVLITMGLTWGALALALRSLESVWHDRVEAMNFIHDTSTPFERTAPIVGRSATYDPGTVANAVADARRQSSDAWRLYMATTFTPNEAAMVENVTPTVLSAHAAADSLVSVLQRSDSTRAERITDSVYLPAVTRLARELEPLIELQVNVTREQVDMAHRRYTISKALLAASAVATMLLIGTAVEGGRRRPWRR